MLIPLWGNAFGFAIMVFWWAVSLFCSERVTATLGTGYFLAISWAATDLLVRLALTKRAIQVNAIPTSVNGSRNADSMWLVSSLGPTFYVPVWMLAVGVATGTYALDHWV